jgi:[acyl-carrier-protein] S-malonyltransferase
VKLALLFPGQGSQHSGMGRDLAAQEPAARAVFDEADDVLGFALSDLMWNGPEDTLTETRNAQPALLTHAIAAYMVARERMAPVAMAAGHSLGEFSAHVAAGALAFADALRAVRVRGELMYEAGLARTGTMAAILGLDDEAVEELCGAVRSGTCVPANFNSAGQVVVSGDREGVTEGMRLATEVGARRVVELNVSGAFHSPLMAPAEDGLRAHLREVAFRDPEYPVVANVTAAPVTTGDAARDLLVRQLTSPVRWARCVATMVEAGVDAFVELGPGSVLCGLNRRNARGVRCVPVGEPRDFARLDGLD